MEPMESRLTTIVYDPSGNVSGLAAPLGERVAQEGSGPIVTYTYDPKSGILQITQSEEPGSSNDAGQ